MLHLSRVFALSLIRLLLTVFGTTDSSRNVGKSFHCGTLGFCPYVMPT